MADQKTPGRKKRAGGRVGTYSEEFGDAFQGHILAVMARVPTFVMSHRTALSETYFASTTRQNITKALLGFVDEFKQVPTRATLVEYIRPNVSDDDIAAIEKEVGSLYTDDITDWQAVKQKAVRFGKVQAVVNAAINTAEDVERGDLTNVLERTQKALMVGEDILDMGLDYLGELPDRERWYNPDDVMKNVIPTGLLHLDESIGGGPSRGELWCVVAPPKKGKTSTLINIGYGALTQGFNVVHYTFEIGKQKVGIRYDDRLMGSQVIHKRVHPGKYAEMVRDRAGKFIKGQLFVKSYATRTCTPSMLRTHLSMLHAEGFTPDVIIVDYADIMQAESRLRYHEMRHEQAGIYEDLRTLASSFDAVVWTASQTSKGALEKDKVTMTDLAEAFEKAAIVDGLIGFSQTEDEAVDKRCRLFLAAVRHEESERFVDCRIERVWCTITTEALYDLSHAQVETKHDTLDPAVSKGRKLAAGAEADAGEAPAPARAQHKKPAGSKGKKPAGSKKPAKRRGGSSAAVDRIRKQVME